MSGYDAIKKHSDKRREERASSAQRITTLIGELFFYLQWPQEKWGAFAPVPERMGGQNCTAWYQIGDGPREVLEVTYEPTSDRDVWTAKWKAPGGEGSKTINEADADDESRLEFCEACGKDIR